MTASEFTNAIKLELDRLDACDSDSNCSGIAVYADAMLPRDWVRLSDGTGEAYGLATEVLEALREVDYDPEATVEQEADSVVCTDPDCYGGSLPEDPDLFHGHAVSETVQRDNGFELA